MKAIGIFVEGDKLVTESELFERHFLIAKPGIHFARNCDMAYKLHIPFYLFWTNKMSKRDVDYGLQNLPPADDYYQFKELDQILYAGDPSYKIPKVIDGIFLDNSMLDDGAGGFLNPTWIAAMGRYMLDNLKTRYGLKTFLYMTRGSLLYWKGKQSIEEINNFLIERGEISTATMLLEKVVLSDFSKPILPYDDSSKIRWNFWWYSKQSGYYLVMYNGTVGQLEETCYNDYIKPDDDVIDPVILPVNEPAQMDRIEAMLINMNTNLSELAKFITGKH